MLRKYALAALCLLAAALPFFAQADEYTVDQVRHYVDGVAQQTLSVVTGSASKES